MLEDEESSIHSGFHSSCRSIPPIQLFGWAGNGFRTKDDFLFPAKLTHRM